MKNMIDQSALVTESDYLSLSGTLTVKHNLLIDQITSAQHQLYDQAAEVIKLLRQPIPFKLWQHYCYKRQLTDDKILEILIFLNTIGGLEIKRSLTGHRAIIYQQFYRLIKGQTPARRARRWSPNLITLSLAILVAMKPLLPLVLATAILAYGVNLTTDFIIIGLLTLLVTIWLSIIAHESAHNLIIKRHKCRHVVLQKGLRLGILHKTLPTKVEFKSALLGPTVGAIAGLLVGVVVGELVDYFDWAMFIGGSVAIMHFVSWLPSYGDGQVVWNNIKELTT